VHHHDYPALLSSPFAIFVADENAEPGTQKQSLSVDELDKQFMVPDMSCPLFFPAGVLRTKSPGSTGEKVWPFSGGFCPLPDQRLYSKTTTFP
jgi:hypothetical protein